MRPQTEFAERGMDGTSVGTHGCPSCHAVMTAEMRFCRMCGFRLGESVEEYTETRRFDDVQPPKAPLAVPTAPLASVNTDSMFKRAGAGMMKCAPIGGKASFGMWALIILITLGILGGASIKKMSGLDSGRTGATAAATRSFVGMIFEDARGGGVMVATLRGVGAPAERAGLIGGDIIKSYDGKPVQGENDLSRLIRATPVGKSVEVVFLRDGETKRTILTTASLAAFEAGAFSAPQMPEGSGFLGIDPGDLERVRVDGENVYGVQLGEVLRNRPADIAGLRKDDVVVEFNGTPVRTTRDFIRLINRTPPGTLASVVVVRDGQRLEIPVKMGRD